ncbi:MAG: DUF6265 family protein [Hyphomonadaceae bacterium]
MRSLVLAAALLFAPHSQAQSINDLAWLKGCWRTEASRDATETSVVTEVWVAPPTNAMFGYAYTIRDGENRSWEQMRIEMIEGWPHFVALLPGQNPVQFRLHDPADLIHLDSEPEDFAVFENAAHDYPQRIIYSREGRRLTATISLADGGNPFVYAYRRVGCPASVRP